MIAERRRNWDVHVTTWAISQRGRAFVWGETDCGYLVRNAHSVMYAEDLYAALGEWNSEYSAGRVLVAHGGMGAILEARGGFRVPFTMLQTGDVVLGEGTDRAASVAIAGHLLTVDEAGGVELLERPATVPGEAVVYRLPWVVEVPRG